MEKNIKNISKVIIFIAVAFTLLSSAFIIKQSVNILWADEWDTPGNLLIKEINNPKDVGINDFFSQHNESRKFFPKLIYYTAFNMGIFDTRIGVLIRLILSATTIYLLYNLSKSKCYLHNASILLFSCLLVFIPTQAYNQIFGLQFITAVPSFCIILNIFLNKYLNNKFLIIFFTAVLCIVSTFSYSNGIIIWVICNPFILHFLKITRFKKWHLLVFNSLFLVTVILYFVDYKHPAQHPGFQEGLSEPIRALKYFTLWFFSPFLIGLSHPVFVSLVLTTIYFGYFFFILSKIIRVFMQSKKLCWSTLCALFLIIYSSASCTIASLGRSGFGYMAALGPQYPSFALWAHLGILVLTFSRSINLNQQTKNMVICFYSILYLFSLEIGFSSFQNWSQKMKQAKLTVENLDICPNNSLINEFHPSSSSVKSKIESFASVGIIDFQNNQWIKSLQKKDALFPGESGWVTISQSQNSINFNGWASIPVSKKPADYVLIGVHYKDQFVPLTFVLPHLKRTDVQNALKVKVNSNYGFNKTIKMPKHLSKLTPYCYSVNEADNKYYKISEI
ncbi:hypothetical protein OAN13_04230 [Opitutales bacterium]|nr:hypothetical protein [Opitutales bacterium]